MNWIRFAIGVSIPLIFVALFWKELREKRERIIKKIRSIFNKQED